MAKYSPLSNIYELLYRNFEFNDFPETENLDSKTKFVHVPRLYSCVQIQTNIRSIKTLEICAHGWNYIMAF